jgi:hypothetical protein
MAGSVTELVHQDLPLIAPPPQAQGPAKLSVHFIYFHDATNQPDARDHVWPDNADVAKRQANVLNDTEKGGLKRDIQQSMRRRLLEVQE